ncbi:MAG: nucleoside-diphosphate kinase [Holosporaceae bacterium]|nr:nucleoside-diphosphate kinase [Holosporaceae bacterium]
MQEEETFAIPAKPEIVEKGQIGEILSRIEKAGFKIKALKMVRLTKEQAAEFYREHKNKPFFDSLCTYMSKGRVVVAILSGPDAIKRYRTLEGATDPKKAAKGTLRGDFGTDREANAVHGSDSPESAKREIRFFFSEFETLANAGQKHSAPQKNFAR